MDNRRIDITTEGRQDFELAMKLAICRENRIPHKTVGYRVEKETMFLYWADSDRMVKLPYEMDLTDTINFVWGWLQKNPPAKPQPDHDGHNKHGFRVYNEAWGHVGGEWQAFIAIKPIWAMYGK